MDVDVDLTYGERVAAIEDRIAGLASQRAGLYAEAKVKAKEMREEGWSVREVAFALGLPRSTVGSWTAGLGEGSGVQVQRVAVCQRILDLHMLGRTTEAIGREVGMSAGGVSWNLKGMQRRWPHLRMKKGQRWLYQGPRETVVVEAADVASWARSKR